MRLRHLVRYSIIKLAPPVPARTQMFLSMVDMGRWMRTQRPAASYPDRDDYFAWLQREIVGDEPVAYLEFGVYKGNSIRIWSTNNQHPDSRFVGFDTFEGLPEAWVHGTGTMGPGHFSVGGKTPDIDDDRVSFVKGIFQDTLEGFLETFERGDRRLVIHLDADLYSSTLYVLVKLDHLLKPGDLLLLDEANVADHEYRAVVDYGAAFLREYELIATGGNDFPQLALRVTA